MERALVIYDLVWTPKTLIASHEAEAVLRTVANRAKVSPVHTSSESLAKNLYAHGFLDYEQYETLREGLKARNAIVYGYQDPPTYAFLLPKVQEITRQLLHEEQVAPVYA